MLELLSRLQNDIWKPFIKNYINDENSAWAGWEVQELFLQLVMDFLGVL